MKKAQLKIQEMAFVLVALFLFFLLIGLFYLSFKIHSFKSSVGNLKEQEAKAMVRKIAATPELRWGECSGCIDLDKALVLKESMGSNKTLEGLWDLEYLAIETIYPAKPDKICNLGNYPECGKLVLLKRNENYGKAYTSFVSLCRWDNEKNSQKCELGKIYAAGRLLNE